MLSDAVDKIRVNLLKVLNAKALKIQLTEKMTKIIETDDELKKERKALMKKAKKEIKVKVDKYTKIFERAKSCITTKVSDRASSSNRAFLSRVCDRHWSPGCRWNKLRLRSRSSRRPAPQFSKRARQSPSMSRRTVARSDGRHCHLSSPEQRR
jgi:hypothetical protein